MSAAAALIWATQGHLSAGDPRSTYRSRTRSRGVCACETETSCHACMSTSLPPRDRAASSRLRVNQPVGLADPLRRVRLSAPSGQNERGGSIVDQPPRAGPYPPVRGQRGVSFLLTDQVRRKGGAQVALARRSHLRRRRSAGWSSPHRRGQPERRTSRGRDQACCLPIAITLAADTVRHGAAVCGGIGCAVGVAR